MQYVNCEFGIIVGSLPEHTPAACLGAFHAFLRPGTQAPPCNQINQQGCQSIGLELQKYIYYLP